MSDKVLSIVIPVYNVQDYLVQCLDSIFNGFSLENAPRVEIIVVNDGSTDNSSKILADYKEKYDFILINQENKGVSGARNTGIKQATGKYVWFVDSDDFLIPNAVDIALNFIRRHPTGDLFLFPYYKLDYSNKLLRQTHPFKPCSGEQLFAAQIDKKIDVVVWNKLVSLNLIHTHNLYFIDGLLYEDAEWMPRVLVFSTQVYYGQCPLYCYRTQSIGSIMHHTRQQQHSPTQYLIFLRIANSLYDFAQNSNISSKSKKLILQRVSEHFWDAISGLKQTHFDKTLQDELEKHLFFGKFSNWHRRNIYYPFVKIFGLKCFARFHK